jgi:uncharacterized protein (TIGR00661 family)
MTDEGIRLYCTINIFKIKTVIPCFMNIIYGVCSWGLGHATRSLPVIRKLTDENHNLTIISSGRALQVLQKELKDVVSYVDIPDYPILISDTVYQFMVKSVLYWPLIIRRIQSGLSQVTKIVQKGRYHLIISDGRYDIYNKKIPSFFISHQIRIMNPLRIKFLERGSEYFNKFFFKRFAGVLVPDYQTDDFTGELSHNLKAINEKALFYVGILSDFEKEQVKQDIDYLISLSGPEPQRTILEKHILAQLDDLSGNIVMTLGKTEESCEKYDDNIEVHSFLTKKKREYLMNRAKMIISRSGYSTIMDLAVLGTKALMIPTPGQIEQEYLARYLSKKGIFYSVNQDKMVLKRDVDLAQKTTGISRKCGVDKTVENIMDILYSHHI